MRLPPAAPPHLTILPVVVPTAALEDLAALQAIDQTHDNGFEPLMERAAVSDWLSAGLSSKLLLPRYELPQQVSDAGILGPVWVITEPDSVARLIAALTPKEAAHNVSKELVNLRFTQRLGEDKDGGVYLACHVQLMNLFANRVIIPVFRSTKSYMEAVYNSDLLCPWALRRLDRPSQSRIHFYITCAQAQHVVPALQEGNCHLHPFYTWSILDSNGSAYVLVHLKRRIYSHYQYCRLTVLDSSPNPSDAGKGTGAAKGGRHRSGTVSTDSATQLTLPLKVAADLLNKLDCFAKKKRMEGAFLPPKPASWAPLAEKLRMKYSPFLFLPSKKELLLLRQRDLDNARAVCRTAARLSLPATLSALGYIPKLPSSWFNKLRRGTASIGKPITVSQANFKAVKGKSLTESGQL
ncbi:hypothetical protein Rhopal_000867-T1 [Rhodotorula paludigena]|uniref:Uncharacterized protein n=1 Tax=Rhodotorula paludigena TaxID=86838 RepID=A0AAV5GEY1_9BASI|nr:hypothetical protein Rhopal_000867-T1 [Rhodotorula paludigena]